MMCLLEDVSLYKESLTGGGGGGGVDIMLGRAVEAEGLAYLMRSMIRVRLAKPGFPGGPQGTQKNPSFCE